MTRSRVVAALCSCLLLAVASASAAGGEPPAVDLSRAGECNFIAAQEGKECMLPFPDDFHTVRDKSTRTGRRVSFGAASMPQNSFGTPIDPADYNFNDGFSPGQTAVVRVPGLDNPAALAATDPVGLANLARYRNKKAPVVVIDAKTGERWPIWVEIDSNADSSDETAVLIHPAVNYHQKHRYIVAMRKLENAAGERLPAPPGFQYYRDEIVSEEPAIEAQRMRFERIFKNLRKARIRRGNLYLAWDFTVSSDINIAERVLHMRDDAFAQLGDRKLADRKVKGASPSFTVSGVTELAPCGADGCGEGESGDVQRRIDGSFTVPCYLEPNCAPRGRFVLGEDGLPAQNGTWEANFRCIVPRAGVDADGAATASRPQLYGHGLLGNAQQASSEAQTTLAQRHGFVICATDEIGFSSSDLPNIATNIVTDMGNFPELTDRVQQALLNELYLGRLMLHAEGFDSHPAFHQDASSLSSPSVIKRSRLYYNGNSQGGVLGGALTAIAPDFTRASLGVPAVNYSVLLNRSVDFDIFGAILNTSYPSKLRQQLVLSMIQMLWDRSDPNGFAHRMTDRPLPNTPSHEVLLNVAFGDHQVTTWQADVEARTIGARAHKPIVDPGRWSGVRQLWGIKRLRARDEPYRGSAIVYWDSGPLRVDPENPGEMIGTDPPPLTNTPNRSGEDPHFDPRIEEAEQKMVSKFLRPNRRSKIPDTCKGPCYAGGFSGP